MADFMKHEPNAKRDEAMLAWEEVKRIAAPKTYEARKNRK
jgi:hypothetical protein